MPYRVQFEILSDADEPLAAARDAYAQLQAATPAPVAEVVAVDDQGVATGESQEIDLEAEGLDD